MNPCSSSSESPNKLLGVLLLSKLRSSSCYSSYSARQLLSDYVAREFNILQWVSLITVTVYLLGRVLRVIRLWREGSKLPGPPCPSFYGHPKLFSRENFVDALSGFHDMYGSIFKLWLGPAQLLVSIKDPEIIREVILKAEDKLPLTANHRAFRLAFGRPRLFTASSSFDEVYVEIMLGREVSLRKDQKNVEDMGLLTATVYESARLLPARPLLQRFSLENDLHLKSGAIIPAGAVLVMHVQLVQTDGSSWGEDVMDFNPYRFVSSGQKESFSAKFTGPVEEIQSKEKLLFLNDPNENAAFLPFGSGACACACVGRRFVIPCLVPLFSSMLEHHEIRLQPRSEAADHLKQSSDSCALQLLPNPEVEFIKRTN